jgi:starch phosphorylase
MSPTTRLHDLAFNLWWTWHPEVIELFRELDPALWRATNHNPLMLLRRLGDDEVASRVAAHLARGAGQLPSPANARYYLEPATWCAQELPALLSAPQAHFLSGVRPPRVPAVVLRRARRAGG